MTAFCCWSGGKESSLSCFEAMRSHNVKITHLLNMTSEDGKYSRTHGISARLLRLQAEAMGIPLVQRKTTWQTYEEEFKKAVLDLKKNGIDTGIFGDIDLQEHRDWVERVCQDMGITPVLPLWKKKREELLEEFIQAGFKAIVVTTDAQFLGKEWLGEKIDEDFIGKLSAHGSVDLCGERGEYHTFVYDGPIFSKPMEFTLGRKVLRDKYWFLELLP